MAMSVSGIGSAPSSGSPLRLPAQAAGTQDVNGFAERAQAGPDAASTPASAQGERTETTRAGDARAGGKVAEGLTAEQLVELDKLKARDTEVRQHETAHQGAGGAYAGSASFTFTRGPDGKRYATGGEVSVDTAPIPGKPDETIAKMRIIQQAALAPAEPSSQDRRVAAQAARAMLQAQSDLLQQQHAAQATAGDDGRQRARAADAYREGERISAE
jgi:hypothetical protein